MYLTFINHIHQFLIFSIQSVIPQLSVSAAARSPVLEAPRPSLYTRTLHTNKVPHACRAADSRTQPDLFYWRPTFAAWIHSHEIAAES